MIRNVHSREIPVPPARVGALLDDLAAPGSVWPSAHWPALRLDRGLEVGSAGGHGPIRYHVSDYRRGRRLEFTFAPSMGIEGTHTFEVHAGTEPGSTLVRHVLTGQPRGITRLRWALGIRWLHDALVEDLLDNVATAVGHPPATRARWSPWVRLLRKSIIRRGAHREPAVT
jgi:Polyketide cyclase / dehydrase and lipid transport